MKIKEDCYYYFDLQDMGAHTPCCSKTGEITNCDCKECKDYIPKSIIHCKDCKFFEIREWWKDIGHGAKILMADKCPTCTKWGEGCKTSPSGYCYLAERKEHINDNKNRGS